MAGKAVNQDFFMSSCDNMPMRPSISFELTDTLSLNLFESSIFTECHRRNGPNFGRVFLMLNYTDITQNTCIQS